VGIAVLQKVLTFQLSFLIPDSDISFRGQIHSLTLGQNNHTHPFLTPSPPSAGEQTVVGDIQTPMQIPFTSARIGHRGKMGQFAGTQAPHCHPHLHHFSISISQSLFFVMVLGVQDGDVASVPLLPPLSFHLGSIYLHFSHVSSCHHLVLPSPLLRLSVCLESYYRDCHMPLNLHMLNPT